MGALLGGMQGQQPTAPMQGGVPAQAQGGTGYAGTSALGMGGQQGGNGLLTLLAPLLIQAMGQQQGGGQGGGLLSMLLGQGGQQQQAQNGGSGLLPMGQQQGLSGVGSPRAQGAAGDVGGTVAAMNPLTNNPAHNINQNIAPSS